LKGIGGARSHPNPPACVSINSNRQGDGLGGNDDSDVAILFEGSHACFTRPEFKIERVSYDVMTPSAARGALDSIFWRPDMKWSVRRISVLSPIRFATVSRNEIAIKGRVARELEINGAGAPLYIDANEHRQKRSSMLLSNVAYIVEARIVLSGGHDCARLKKYRALLTRRVERGRCFQQPYLGCREFVAEFRFACSTDRKPIAETRRLGWMLKEIVWNGDRATPEFFQAELVQGVLTVPTQAHQLTRP
jgi:CRISPR-associated protein Cas5d